MLLPKSSKSSILGHSGCAHATPTLLWLCTRVHTPQGLELRKGWRRALQRSEGRRAGGLRLSAERGRRQWNGRGRLLHVPWHGAYNAIHKHPRRGGRGRQIRGAAAGVACHVLANVIQYHHECGGAVCTVHVHCERLTRVAHVEQWVSVPGNAHGTHATRRTCKL